MSMTTIKKYNLAGLNANVELGKKGSYIAGTANAIGFYTVNSDLQKLEIANATLSTHAVTKAQLDAIQAGMVQHITVDFDYNSGTSEIANIATGSRIISVTVDIPWPWSGVTDNTTSFVEVGDTSNASRFIRAQDVDVTKAAQYHSQYQYEYLTDGVLTLKVTQGSAASGTGTVSVVLASDAVTVRDYGSINQAQNSNVDLGNVAV